MKIIHFFLVLIIASLSSCLSNKTASDVSYDPAITTPISIPEGVLTTATTNAPLVYLHPNDPYRPSSVEWYLPQVALFNGPFTSRARSSDTSTEIDLKLQVGEVTPQILIEQRHGNEVSGIPDKPYYDKINTTSDFFLDIPVGQEITREGDLANAPCYCHIRKATSTEWQINYLFFYPYNADIVATDEILAQLSGLISTNSVTADILRDSLGSHEGDWEYFALRYNEGENKVTKVFYSAHDSEGKWYDEGNYPKEQGQPVVYSSNKSHANYPTIGEHIRKFNLLPSDHTSDAGPVWNCKQNLEILNHTKPIWLNYNGRWGRLDDKIIKAGKPPFGPATKAYW